MSNKRPPQRNSGGRFVKARGEEEAKRAADAARLRSQGASYALIAQRLGIGKTTAYDLVQSVYADICLEPGTAALTLELERLDSELLTLNTAQAKVLSRMSDGEFMPKGVELLVKLTEARCKVGDRRARLRGLDAPTALQVTGAESVTREDIAALIQAGETAQDTEGVDGDAAH